MHKKGKITKKQSKGITLIALVITIIVLLILAGVSINAMLSGNNSAPQKASEAVEKDAIAGAKDEVVMEAQSALLDYYNKKYVGRNETDEASTQEIVSNAAEKAVNSAKNKNKRLLSDSGVTDNTITLQTKSYTLTGTIDEKGNITWNSILKEYLVDVADIGEYVDIGINYQNMQKFISNDDIVTTNELTGWRVLSKEGTGKDGTIKLVSAGCPLTYNHSYGQSDLSISTLGDLSTIQITDSGKGFRKNGFESDNLKELFSKNNCIDIEKGIHALGCSTDRDGNNGNPNVNEIERLYQDITGKEKIAMQDLAVTSEEILRNSSSEKR